MTHNNRWGLQLHERRADGRWVAHVQLHLNGHEVMLWGESHESADAAHLDALGTLAASARFIKAGPGRLPAA